MLLLLFSGSGGGGPPPATIALPRFALRLECVVQVTIFPPGAEIEAVYAPLLGIEAAAPPLYNETHAPALGLEEIR